MPKITITFFAALSDLTGTSHLNWEIPEGTTIGDLKKRLIETYPDLEDAFRHGLEIVIGDTIAHDDDVIPQNARIALFYPK